MRFHACVKSPEGLVVFDTCPSESVFRDFMASGRLSGGCPLTACRSRRSPSIRGGGSCEYQSMWPGELIEAAAYASLYAAAPSPLEGDESMLVQRFGHVGARVCEPLRDAPVLNSVLCAGAGGLALNDELKLVDDALEWMREHRAGGYLSVAPGTSTERALIEERGFARGYAWMKFSCDLTGAPSNSAKPRICG